jgi:hypothetical protein
MGGIYQEEDPVRHAKPDKIYGEIGSIAIQDE